MFFHSVSKSVTSSPFMAASWASVEKISIDFMRLSFSIGVAPLAMTSFHSALTCSGVPALATSWITGG